MAAHLDDAFEQLIKSGHLPGAGAVVIDKSGNELYNHSAGTINVNDASAKPFTNDTQLLLYSCTKFIASIAFLQLLERGLISSLDDPITKYLPDEANVGVFTGFDDQNQAVTRPPKVDVKLINLLTHTSGHCYDFWDEHMYQYRISKSQPPGKYNGIGAAWQFSDVFLKFDPGEKFNYGINTDKLGFMVEKVAGQTLPEYIKENITDPLGMHNTGVRPATDEWLRVHIKDEAGKLTAVEAIKLADNPERFGGGSCMISTLNDYSQLLLTILNDGLSPRTGNRILKPDTIDEYVFKDLIPQVGCSSDGIGVFGQSLTPGSSNAGEMLRGTKKGFGGGLMLNLEDIPDRRKAESGTWAGLANLYYWIDRRSGLAGIFGTAVLPFLDSDALELFDKVEKFAYTVR